MMNNFSKIGFILAALGSSIGLGHIWRFPHMAGTNGGGAFVLLYLFLSLFIGIAMLIGEMLIGNKGRANTSQSYAALDPTKGKKWRYAGLTIIGGPIILTFYSVVLGWVFYYLFFVSFNLPSNMDASKELFGALYGDGFLAQSFGLVFVMGLTAWIISRGVKNGIELLNLILTPLLFIIFFGLMIYAMSMDSFAQAAKFMLSIDLERAKEAVTLNVLVDSLGQVFFSLSLGVGIIITYAASSESNQNLLKSSLWIVSSGLLIAIMAGLMIFTFVFEYGTEADVGAGAGLVFVTLPVMLSHLGFLGNIIAVLFLVAFSFAGITSTISLLEPAVMYVSESYGWSRAKATWIITAAIIAGGFIIICSICTPLSSTLTFGGKSLMDIVDFFSANFLMSVGGLLAVIFIGWVVPKQALREYTSHFFNELSFLVWHAIMRYIAPVITIVILIAICVKFFTGQDAVDFIFESLGV